MLKIGSSPNGKDDDYALYGVDYGEVQNHPECNQGCNLLGSNPQVR